MQQEINLNSASELVPSTAPPDFDFSVPCRYFKSSFARSLSLNNAGSNQCKSLDFDVNHQHCSNTNNLTVVDMVKNVCPPLVQRPSRSNVVASSTQPTLTPVSINLGIAKNEVNYCDAVKPLPPPAIPTRREMPASSLDSTKQAAALLTQFGHSATTTAVGITSGNGNFNKVFSHHHHQQQQQQQHPCTNNNNNNNNNNFRRNIVWPRENTEQDCIEAPINVGNAAPFDVQENAPNVEAVLLQNQVDTLQWQFKQVETSCEMYRAVMEEVARFLERYQCQKQQQRVQQQKRHSMEQIARSKSLYHVYGIDKNPSGDESSIPAAYLRARSSTNLIDLKQQLANNAKCNTLEQQNYDANSYSAFKDFTWRRSPKKPNHNSRSQTPTDDMEEKLNQEAFRLSRTIQNLLNTSTQQPDLMTHHRNSLSSVSLGRLSNKTPSASTMTLHAPLHNSTILSGNGGGANKENNAAAAALNTITPKCANTHATELIFLRAANMRDSRLSLRSSTDSSVHSTTSSAASSSSKVETDDEPTAATSFHSPALLAPSKRMQAHGSTTEDESGFSSISSFQDIGVPLISSTLISNAPLTTSANNGQHNTKELSNTLPLDTTNIDSRNSTLKAALPNFDIIADTETHPNNVVGVPLNATHDMQHRWDVSSAKTYRNTNKLQRFSTLSNEDSATVLWV